MIQNPYQTEIETKCIFHQGHGKYSQIRLAQPGLPNYRALNLPEESATINGFPILKINWTGEDPTYTIRAQVKKGPVNLAVDPGDRKKTLRDVSLRLLLTHALSFYYNRQPHGIRSFDQDGKRKLYFTVWGPRDQDRALDLAKNLEGILEAYIRTGLDIRTRSSKGGQTAIFGLATLPYLGPHLFNTSEIYRFHCDLDRPARHGYRFKFILD